MDWHLEVRIQARDRQYSSCPLIQETKITKILNILTFSVPRRARYVHSAWKSHKDAVFWVDIDLAIREGLTFYQTRSNAIILQGTLPAYCIQFHLCPMMTGGVSVVRCNKVRIRRCHLSLLAKVEVFV